MRIPTTARSKKTLPLAVLGVRIEQLLTEAEAAGRHTHGYKGLPREYWEGYRDALTREVHALKNIVKLVETRRDP